MVRLLAASSSAGDGQDLRYSAVEVIKATSSG